MLTIAHDDLPNRAKSPEKRAKRIFENLGLS